MPRFDNYIPRPRKVKHVKIIESPMLDRLEAEINLFADSNPNCKILGIRVTVDRCAYEATYIGTITYLENAKEDDYGTDEEGYLD